MRGSYTCTCPALSRGTLSGDLWARGAPLLSLDPGTLCCLALSHTHVMGITRTSQHAAGLFNSFVSGSWLRAVDWTKVVGVASGLTSADLHLVISFMPLSYNMSRPDPGRPGRRLVPKAGLHRVQEL